MYFGFEDITIAFRTKTVLQHVTLDIPRGKIVTIIGQNGCGKSSLLKTVSKAVTCSSSTCKRNATAPKFPPKRWICAECWTLCA